MDEQGSAGAGNDPNRNGPTRNLTPPSPQQSANSTGQQNNASSSKERYWRSFLSAGADRHIELALGVLIASFACFQLVASCNNSRTSTEQLTRMIVAADRIDDAADSFSLSASGINGGVSDAVKKLDAQRVSSERESKNL